MKKISPHAMTRLGHLLWHLSEGAAEASQRASKAAKFGLLEVQVGQEGPPLTNAERLRRECADFVAVMEMIEELEPEAFRLLDSIDPPSVPFRELVATKKTKVIKWLGYCDSIGMLRPNVAFCLDSNMTPAAVRDGLAEYLEETLNKPEAATLVREIEINPTGAAPVDMILYCPNCGKKHVDGPSESAEIRGGELCVDRRENKPHRSHQCHDPKCGCIWRPADFCTNGVESLQTHGARDTWPNEHNEEVRAAPVAKNG